MTQARRRTRGNVRSIKPLHTQMLALLNKVNLDDFNFGAPIVDAEAGEVVLESQALVEELVAEMRHFVTQFEARQKEYLAMQKAEGMQAVLADNPEMQAELLRMYAASLGQEVPDTGASEDDEDNDIDALDDRQFS